LKGTWRSVLEDVATTGNDDKRKRVVDAGESVDRGEIAMIEPAFRARRKATTALPGVTVLIPMRNEEDYIGPCLESLLQCDYPADLLEILVLDGMSDDRSREVVEEVSKRFPFVRLLENPGRIVSTGLNVGIAEAAHPVIVRADAHAEYDRNYIRKSVELLMTEDAAVVGGLQSARGYNYFTGALAAALASRFAAGGARYRLSDRTEYVDTVFLGAWWRESLVAIGGFHEEWVVNQDYELNARFRRHGQKVLLSPEIKSSYFPRNGMKPLMRQQYRYGFWRARTMLAHPWSVRLRQLAAPALIVGLGASLVALPFSPIPLLATAGAYTGANLLASALTAARSSPKFFPILPIIFAAIHLSWGTGFCLGAPYALMRRVEKYRPEVPYRPPHSLAAPRRTLSDAHESD
jgi:succinoglycan biosynthesis protein ExoA